MDWGERTSVIPLRFVDLPNSSGVRAKMSQSVAHVVDLRVIAVHAAACRCAYPAIHDQVQTIDQRLRRPSHSQPSNRRVWSRYRAVTGSRQLGVDGALRTGVYG